MSCPAASVGSTCPLETACPNCYQIFYTETSTISYDWAKRESPELRLGAFPTPPPPFSKLVRKTQPTMCAKVPKACPFRIPTKPPLQSTAPLYLGCLQVSPPGRRRKRRGVRPEASWTLKSRSSHASASGVPWGAALWHGLRCHTGPTRFHVELSLLWIQC